MRPTEPCDPQGHGPDGFQGAGSCLFFWVSNRLRACVSLNMATVYLDALGAGTPVVPAKPVPNVMARPLLQKTSLVVWDVQLLPPHGHCLAIWHFP